MTKCYPKFRINFPKKTDWAGLGRTFRFPRRSWEASEACNLQVKLLCPDFRTDGWMDYNRKFSCFEPIYNNVLASLRHSQ